MNNEFHTGYQYDRCISRGICSINPTTASLLEVILIYLKYGAKYCLTIKEKDDQYDKIINLILNTISVLSSYYEISETNFNIINNTFQKELPEILKTIEPENSETNPLISCKSLKDFIRFGEKEFNKRIQSMPVIIRNLYRILFILIKSLCINILTYKSYNKKPEKEIYSLLNVLNLLNSFQKDKKELKNTIYYIAKQDCELMEKIRNIQEENYGKQGEYDISFSTKKGKAILVVGSNLKELEQILDKLENKNIDIYTHDNMILAHTFPKFREYKNLKGQFGQGIENCLLDFSTFPGPIILTKHSLFNIENLYRGRLFSTDFSYSKGVIPIKNNDFSEVIKSAEEAKGFKTGKICKPEKIGFNLEKFLNIINDKLAEKLYKQIIIIGINGYSTEENEYFENFIKHISKDILIISLSCFKTKNNLINFNIGTDVYAMYKLCQEIIKLNYKTTIFVPFSDRHTLSIIINLSLNKNKIYMGKWHHALLNPHISDGLKKEFYIIEMTSPKKDYDNIIKAK